MARAAPTRQTLAFPPRASCDFGAISSSVASSTFADDDELQVAQSTGKALDTAAEPEPECEEKGSGCLALSTRIEYSSIPKGCMRNVFGLVTLQAAEAKVEQKEKHQAVDIITVLDVSGSMRGEKLLLVQEALSFVIRESHAQDRLSVVSFNSTAARRLRMRRMDEEGKAEAMQATRGLSAGGGTSIASGLSAALEVAERRRQRNPVSAILLLTDGQDGRSAAALPDLIRRANHLGCSVYPFGFGASHDAQMLSNLAEQAKTPFTFIEDVSGIASAFAGALGGLISVCAQRIEVTLACEAVLTAVHTPFTTTLMEKSAKIQIPDILAGERRDILVELTVPEVAAAEETVLLHASAKYWDLGTESSVQMPAVQLRAQRVSDTEQPEQEPDEEVCVQRHRVQVAQTLQAAAEHGEDGRFEEAQGILDSQLTQLRSTGKKVSKITEDLASELEDAKGRMRSRSSWEDGGRAEVLDARQMHLQQRATNVCQSSKSLQKKTKAMYVNRQQECMIERSMMEKARSRLG